MSEPSGKQGKGKKERKQIMKKFPFLNHSIINFLSTLKGLKSRTCAILHKRKVALVPLSLSVRFCVRISCWDVDGSAYSDLHSCPVAQLQTPPADCQGLSISGFQ